jgi:putative ABC transport system permease protein
VVVEGRPSLTGEQQPTVSYVTIRGRYFDTLGLRLLRGRTFIEADGISGHESVIVNQRFVTMFFPSADPMGQRIRLTPLQPAESDRPAWATIVGIAPTVRQQYFQELDPVVYVPERGETPGLTLLVRGPSAPRTLVPAIRASIFALDPEVALGAVRSLEELMAQSRWGHRVFGGMLMVFACIGLALAAVGLYAVTAYAVVQRTHEVGVRMAIGAHPRTVVWLFVKRGMLPIGVGLGVGLAGALGVGRVLERFLIQTRPTDPITLAGITCVLTVVSLAACVFPARGAARLDPVRALRHD